MRRPLDDLPEASRAALAALARDAVSSHASCIPRPEPVSAVDLSPALGAKMIEACEDGFTFLDPDAHAQALAAVFLTDAEAVWGEPSEIVTLLHKIWSLQHRGRQVRTHPDVHPTARLLLALQGEGHNVVDRLPDLVAADYPEPDRLPPDTPGVNWQQRKIAVTRAIRDAISHLRPTPDQVLALGIAAASYYEDSGDVGHNYLGLGTLARDHPDVACVVLDSTTTEPITAEATSLVPHLLHGLAAVRPDEALRRALALTEQSEPLLTRAGVFALGSLYFADGDARYDSVFERLETLAAMPDPNLDRAIARALSQFPIRADPDRALSILIRLAPRPSATSAVAAAIADLSVHSGPEAYREALLELARSPHLDGDGVEGLRAALYQAPSDLVLEAAEVWVTSRTSAGPSLPDTLDYALDNVPESELDARLPRWLTQSDPRLVRAAAEVINSSRRADKQWAFPAGALAQLDARHLLHLARQILGRVHNGRALTRLCLSFFDRPELPDEVATFLKDRLTDFVAFTRPIEADQILSAIDATAQPAAAGAAQEVLGRVQLYRMALQALPRRTELVPPLDRVRPFLTARRRYERGIFKNAQANSISPLRDLFAEIQVRGGKGFIIERHDGTLAATPFQKIEAGDFSLLGDIIDPVGQAFRRIVWMATPLPEPLADPKRLPVRFERSTPHWRRRPLRRYPRRRTPSRRTPRRR